MAALILLIPILLILTIYKIYSFLSPTYTKQIMQKQGILGPNPKFLLGNLLEMKKIIANASNKHFSAAPHNLEHRFFPSFVEWKKAYGLSNLKLLLVYDCVLDLSTLPVDLPSLFLGKCRKA